MVAVLLANGFETAEALVPVDILRRAGVKVALAGVGGTEILSGQGVSVRADCPVEDLSAESLDMVVLPGGGLGYEILKSHDRVKTLVLEMAEREKLIGAICAAPAILAELGLLKGLRAVCFPSMEEELVKHGARLQRDELVVHDRNIITAQAAGTSFDFGLKLLSALRGWKESEKIRKGICYPSAMPLT